MSDDNEDMDRVKKACAELGEHFDAIQIFVTRYDPQDGTVNINWGSGDYFSRYGKVKHWLLKEESRIALEVQAENNE